jgi:hypothetical protein
VQFGLISTDNTNLTTTGDGTITIYGINSDGSGGGGGGGGWSATGNTTISSYNGAIALSGTDSGSGSYGIGIDAGISSTQTTSITSVTGGITLNGSAKSGGTGINFAGLGQVTLETTGASAIQLNAKADTSVNGMDSSTDAGGINFAYANSGATPTLSVIKTGTSSGQGAIGLDAGNGALTYVGDLIAGTAANTNGTITLAATKAITLGDGTHNQQVTSYGQDISIASSGGALTLKNTAINSHGNATGGKVSLTGVNVSSNTAANNSVDSGNQTILLNALGGTTAYLGSLTSTHTPTPGSEFTDPAITIRSAQIVSPLSYAITLGSINAVNGAVVIGVSGDIAGPVVQNTGSIIKAKYLTGSTTEIVNQNNGSVILDGANEIDNLGQFTTVGAFTLNDATGGLNIIGSVNTGSNPGDSITIPAASASITTAGGVLQLGLDGTGAPAVNANISAYGVSLKGVGVTTWGTSTVNGNGGDITVDGGGGDINLGKSNINSESTGSLTTTSAALSPTITVKNGSQAELGSITAVGVVPTTTTASSTVAIGTSANDFKGGVTQQAGRIINATTLSGLTGGSVNLGNDNTLTNLGSFSTIGEFTLKDLGGLNVTGAVNTGGGVGALASITTESGNLVVNGTSPNSGSVTGNGVILTTTTSGAITFSGTIAGGGTLGTGNVTLNSAGGSTENLGGAVTGAGLLLRGNGTFDLHTDGVNNVATLATNTSGGTVSYKNSKALTIGTVGSTDGITSNNQNVVVEAAGNLTITKDVNSAANTDANPVSLKTTGTGNIIGNGGKIYTKIHKGLA